MRNSVSWLAGGVFLLGLCLADCGGAGPEGAPLHPDLIPGNAYPYEVPAHASSLSPAEFSAMLDRGDITLLTARSIEELARADALARQQAAERAQAIFADRPEILQRHSGLPGTVDPDLEELPGGNYLFDWRGEGASDEKVVTHGSHFTFSELVSARETFHDLENQRAVYATWYNRIPSGLRAQLALPLLEELEQYPLGALIDLNERLAQEAVGLQPISPCIPPPNYSPSWQLEVGADINVGGDISHWVPRLPQNLRAQICFPLKYVGTNVRTQGQRGTCTAFGITAAVETIVHRDYGVQVNLSEQFLYNQALQFWFPKPHVDGLYPFDALLGMHFSLFHYPFEWEWDYNTSMQRLDVGTFYLNSCVGYTCEMCSDAIHQADMYCTVVEGTPFCAYVNPARVIQGSSGYRVGPARSVFDAGALGVAWAKLCVSLGIPVIYSFTVPASWQGIPTDGPTGGYATFLGLEFTEGAHTVLLVGWVPNGDLPAGTPPASGEGYFIVKNSWGSGMGDGGYVYLPDNWVAFWGISMFALDGVMHF